MEELRKVAVKALEECRMDTMNDWASIKSEIKNAISGFLYKKTKRNPMILPVSHGGCESKRGYDREVISPFWTGCGPPGPEIGDIRKRHGPGAMRYSGSVAAHDAG